MQPDEKSWRIRPCKFPALNRRKLVGLLAASAAGSLLPQCAWALADAGNGKSTPADVRTFLDAVRNGNRDAVTGMLDQDAALARATDSTGRSAFVLAYLSGHPEIAALLEERGIELDIIEAVIAAKWDRVEAVAAADPDAMNAAYPIGGNPLYASAITGGVDQYRIRSLGANSDGRPVGGSGFTPARAAMNCIDPIGALLAATDILSNGGHVNAPQAGGDSVLHGAVRARDERLLRFVIRKGGDVSARNDAGETPADVAESLEWRAGVELLQAEAEIARDHRGSRFAVNASREPFALSPIPGIPQSAQSEITGLSHFNLQRVQELLVSNPLLVNSISTDAELAVEACGHTGQRDIIRLHLDYGAPMSLPTAISLGDLDHARWLLVQDPLLINERGPHDFPVMWYPAIGKGSVEAAELLLQHGASIEQESGGETALHWAARRGYPDLVHYLVDNGADVHAIGYRQDRAGLTPLQVAIANDREDAARALRELG